jgi:hypothetical protein
MPGRPEPAASREPSPKNYPNPAQPVVVKRKSRFFGEPKKEINHESIPPWRERHEKDKLNFVLSRFRAFVMKIFFHKMQRIHS